MSDGLFLSNFKLSIKLESISIRHIQQLCLNKDIEHKKYSNFICFKIKRRYKKCRKDPTKPDHFSYSIWKKAEVFRNKNSNTTHSNKSHCNISKVEENEIAKSIRKMLRLLEIPLTKTDYKIDNITATIKTGHKINLRKFAKTADHYKEDISYNPESFPGLTIRKNKLTYTIFTTGSINIVGGKSRKQILKGIPWIKSVVPKLETETACFIESEESEINF